MMEDRAGLRHVTTLWVKSHFHPPNGPQSPLKGDVSVQCQLFGKNGPLQSLPTTLLNHPEPSQMWQ